MTEDKKISGGLIRKFFFLDLLADPRSRLIMVYSFVVITIGAVLFHWIEGWDWLDSFYFVVITITTIGYGDFTPQTSLGKIITIFYGLNGSILLLTVYDLVRHVRGQQRKSFINQEKEIDSKLKETGQN